MKSPWEILNVGLGLAVLTIVGWWVDQTLKTGCIFTYLGVILGILYTCYEIWKATRNTPS